MRSSKSSSYGSRDAGGCPSDCSSSGRSNSSSKSPTSGLRARLGQCGTLETL